MSYRSPLHILEALNLNPDSLDDLSLQRLRKKILTDFQATEAYTVQYGSHEFTKDQVLKILDELKELDHKEDHLALFQNKKVLRFCEDPVNVEIPKYDISEFIQSQPGMNFAQKIIAESEMEYLRSLLRIHQYNKAVDFYEWFRFNAGNYQYLFHEIIGRHTGLLIAYLRHDDKIVLRSEFGQGAYAWMVDSDWVEFYNKIGADYEAERNELASEMVNFTVAFQGINAKFLVKFSRKLCLLRCEPELQKLISKNHRVFAGSISNSKGSGVTWRLIFAGIWVVVMIVRCFQSMDNDTKYTTPTIHYENQFQMDSINRAWQNSERMNRLMRSIDTLDSLSANFKLLKKIRASIRLSDSLRIHDSMIRARAR